jgi:tetratricopeptide (TPR) repeat protein
MTQEYNRDVALERAAIILLNGGQWDAAAALFASLLERKPEHTMAWYGLANALYQLSGQQSSIPTLKIAYACVLRALQEETTNTMAAELATVLRERTPLRDLGTEAFQPDPGPPTDLASAFLSAPRLIQAMQRIPSWEQRMGLMMFLGDQYDERFLPVLLHALEHDPHHDVRMAAMKRLRPWGAAEALRATCERLVATGAWEGIEPYFSMTLRGMGADWAQALVANLPPRSSEGELN